MEKVSRRELQKFKSNYGLSNLQLPVSGPARPVAPARASKRTAKAEETEAIEGDQFDPHANPDVVTREMKLEFVAKIKKLSNSALTSMVQKIKEIKAASISDLPEDKIQIRVDDFDKSEFCLINDFVDDMLFKELPSKRQKTE